jgi:hypothetical protein
MAIHQDSEFTAAPAYFRDGVTDPMEYQPS